MKILAIDVGGTEIKYGILDENFNIFEKSFINSFEDDANRLIDNICSIYYKYSDVDGIALSLPGFVDSNSGMHLGGGCFRSLKNINIKKEIENRCNKKCFVENDGKSATIAEYKLGSLKDTTNSCVFIIGTGVGGGLVINGQLFKGKNSTAGEYSYLNVNINDTNPYKSSLAELCSTRYLLKLYKEYKDSNYELNGREFFNCYYENDLDAIKALDEFSRNVAIEVMNLGILLNVEKVAIGGGISNQDILIKKIVEKLDNLSIFDAYNDTLLFKPEVVRCKYGNDANLIGVTYELIEYLKEN